jgi:hypothetical protein
VTEVQRIISKPWVWKFWVKYLPIYPQAGEVLRSIIPFFLLISVNLVY